MDKMYLNPAFAFIFSDLQKKKGMQGIRPFIVKIRFPEIGSVYVPVWADSKNNAEDEAHEQAMRTSLLYKQSGYNVSVVQNDANDHDVEQTCCVLNLRELHQEAALQAA